MTPDDDRLGLRERKKLKTRVTLRTVAYELFADKGFDNTTVAEIAAAAEVSQATFFRYFSTKEALVVEDDYDAVFLSNMGPIDPGGNVAAQILRMGSLLFGYLDDETRATELERARLLQSSASLRAAQARAFERTADELIAALKAHIEGPVDDVALRVVVGAMIGAVNQVSRTGAAMGPETLLMLAEMFERGLPVSGES
ncbi:TetR family transcriptional regulator [Gordonia sp. TBRC 11910]|uniref:TetR family transcriptional regulator n=2 Tax=Gordonia asplenii TaxID=2725283 RepID=A0A848KWE5_9ACTN|nr:TetR family transcriptional regulator [Gordonia asplenii]